MTVVGRQLGRRLRRLRDAARKTAIDVAEAGLASRVKLWRIETGQGRIKIGDVHGLCLLYGADTGTTEMLCQWAAGARQPGWWEDFDEPLSTRDGLYLGLESTAQHLQVYGPEQVPGPLQTPAYTRALYQAVKPDAKEPAVRAYLKLQQERHTALTQGDPSPRLTAVLNEGALVRPVGGPDVIREQIRLLSELADLVHVDIRYLPWRAGAHAAMNTGGFTILDFAQAEDPAVVYVETHTGAGYRELPSELCQYRRLFSRIYTKSRPISEHRLSGRRA